MPLPSVWRLGGSDRARLCMVEPSHLPTPSRRSGCGGGVAVGARYAPIPCALLHAESGSAALRPGFGSAHRGSQLARWPGSGVSVAMASADHVVAKMPARSAPDFAIRAFGAAPA